MPTTRERLYAVLDTLSDEQLGIVLSFAKALNRGRVVTSVCEPAEGEDQNGMISPRPE